jgi:alkaline phosphatase D
MKQLISIFLLVLGFHLSYSQETPYLVVLSLDGFRWDYPEKASTPTLDSLARSGVKAVSLRPSFPTLTFPNHYSMATGFYPDHHGIVHNSFYDPRLNRHYKIGDRSAVEDSLFYQREPIWVIAEKQGVITASYFWVGTEAPVGGLRPTYWKRYDEKVSLPDRIDTVIAWLSLPEPLRPHLIMFYYHEPDGLGHKHGPESQQVRTCVAELDSLTGILCRKLNALPVADQINLVITSDHGMQGNTPEKTVKVYKYIKEEWFSEIQGYNPVVCFQFREEYEEKALTSLKRIPNTQSWITSEIPGNLHYGSNPRTLDAILLADSGYALMMKKGGWVGKGAHGYDPENRNMHAIFYAIGPAFKVNYRQPEFENVDLVPLFGEILGLELPPVDGKIERVKGMIYE